MQKKLIATTAAISTLGGTIAGATFFSTGGAGAEEAAAVERTAEQEVRIEPGERITTALQGLIDDDTLTENQAEAVIDALENVRPEGRRSGPHTPGLRGESRTRADFSAILGLDNADIRIALRSGLSLAEVAAEQDVDSQELVDAIVTATEHHVAGALERGRIDQEKADDIRASAVERAEAIITGEFEGRSGPGRGPGQGAPRAELNA